MEAIDELAAEVDHAEIIASVEQAAAYAASRSSGKDLKVRLDSESGNLLCYATKRVAVEVLDPETEILLDAVREGASPGDVVEVPVRFETAARPAARAARAVLEARLRAARLLAQAARYRDRVGKLEIGVVTRREGQDLIVNLGPVEGRLPAAEQSRYEVFNPEDTIRAAICAIEPEDPPVILSRIAPEVVAGVIERETPEVRQGVVEVRAVARHPGQRAKVAVWTDAPGVDAVAVCLGPGGSRIRAVSRELRGERVDVVRWHESIEVFARNALRPAEVLEVSRAAPERPSSWTDRTGGGLVVTVSEVQLPRAVGKRGQNVRLASELLGMPIEVVAEGQLPRDSRGPRDDWVSRDSRGPRDGRGSRDDWGSRDNRGPRDSRGPRDGRGSRDDWGSRDNRGPRDDRGWRGRRDRGGGEEPERGRPSQGRRFPSRQEVGPGFRKDSRRPEPRDRAEDSR